MSIFVNCGWSSKGLKIVGSRRGIVKVRMIRNDKNVCKIIKIGFLDTMFYFIPTGQKG